MFLRFCPIIIAILLGTAEVRQADTLGSYSGGGPADALNEYLGELDHAIAQRSEYLSQREERISSLKKLFSGISYTDEQRYAINKSIIDEYIPYQFDSTIRYISRNIGLAQSLNDSIKLCESQIQLAYHYATGGLYLEASSILNGYLSEATVPDSLLLNYYKAQHKLNDELALYSLDARQRAESSHLTDIYCEKILASCPTHSTLSMDLRTWKAIDNRNLKEAKKVAREQLSSMSINSHDFAKVAYMLSIIEELNGDHDMMQIWNVRSAIADIKCAVRDHSSIQRLSSALMADGDIERSMRYLRVVNEDAKFFNSRLRPWQDAKVLPDIENAYYTYRNTRNRQLFLLVTLLGFFILIMILGVIYMGRQNLKINKVNTELQGAYDQLHASTESIRQSNERLRNLNSLITEANTVKEEYIGMFLMMCSEYIGKISNMRKNVRKMLRSSRIQELTQEYSSYTGEEEEDIKEFYSLFDSTFLKLYPSFITEFNSLLVEDARTLPSKGTDTLNTELRIYALIRLGIEDSSKIAALLRYSMSTIYNYRSKYRNLALCPPEEFEEKVRTIGTITVA